ncbi:hypothetical protein CapIbe_017934 [Capra ibex]
MLLSVFTKQELSEPSSDFPAAGLGVNLQARVATLGNLPEPLGQPGTLGLCLDAAPPDPAEQVFCVCQPCPGDRWIVGALGLEVPGPGLG